MTLERSNHCVYQTHYHIVFPVKYRKALLRNEVERSLHEISKEIEERYDLEIEKLGADLNHARLLCSFHTKYSIGQTVRLYKNITAKQLFKRHPELRKELWGGEFWTDGYYAATVGERGNWNIVKNYITQQGKKPEDVNLRLFAF
jgi:putative transposase